jgi:hypothetical protein
MPSRNAVELLLAQPGTAVATEYVKHPTYTTASVDCSQRNHCLRHYSHMRVAADILLLLVPTW